MRRKVSTAMLVICSLASVSMPAVAATKSCKKVGSVKLVSGVQYICEKSKKKLSWVIKQKPPTARAVISGDGALPGSIQDCKLSDSRMLPDGSRPMVLSDYEIPYKPGIDYGYLEVDKKSGFISGNPHLSPGFPLPSGMWPSTGVNRVAVLAVEYLDAPASGNQLAIARKTGEQVNDWLADQSGGKLRLDFKYGDRIFQVQRNSESYKLYSIASNSAPQAIADIVAAADPYFDFTGIETLWVINPKSVGSVPIAGYQLGSIPEDFNFPGSPGHPKGVSVVATNEGVLKRWTGNGAYQYREDNDFWTFFAHEMAHYFGIQDLKYRTQRVQEDGTKTAFDDAQNNQPFSQMDIMSDQDGGSRSIHSFHRLLLNWWDENQIHCQALLPGKTVTAKLGAFSGRTAGVKSLMIRLDQYRLLVVESRRKIGYDQWLDGVAVGVNRGKGLERAYLSELGTSGLIVFVHDVRTPQHYSPSHIQIPNDGRLRTIGHVTCTNCDWGNPNNPNQKWDPKDMRGPQVEVRYDPLIRLNQSVTIEGYTITNLESKTDGDVVSVQRSQS